MKESLERRLGRRTKLQLEETRGAEKKRFQFVEREWFLYLLKIFEEEVKEIHEVKEKAKDATCIRWEEGKGELTFEYTETLDYDAEKITLRVSMEVLEIFRQFLPPWVEGR